MTSKSWAFSSCGKGMLAENVLSARGSMFGGYENIVSTVTLLRWSAIRYFDCFNHGI